MNSRQLKRRKAYLFDEYNANLRMMVNHPQIHLTDRALSGILCPLCLQFHDRSALQDMPRRLTLDHVPPESSGGKDGDTVLVCTRCNSEAGHKSDHHLATFLKQKDILDFVPGSEMDAQYSVGPAKRINGTIKITGNREMSWFTHMHRTNPATVQQMDKYLRSNFGEGSQEALNFQIHLPETDRHLIHVALLRIAYLTYFRWFGYGGILHPHFDVIRKQIIDPTNHYLPDRWNVTGINKGDADNEAITFLFGPTDLRCVLARFSLTTKFSKRTYVICLPSHLPPGPNIYQTLEEMQGQEGEVELRMFEIPKQSIPLLWESPTSYQAPYYFGDYEEASTDLVGHGSTLLRIDDIVDVAINIIPQFAQIVRT